MDIVSIALFVYCQCNRQNVQWNQGLTIMLAFVMGNNAAAELSTSIVIAYSDRIGNHVDMVDSA